MLYGYVSGFLSADSSFPFWAKKFPRPFPAAVPCSSSILCTSAALFPNDHVEIRDYCSCTTTNGRVVVIPIPMVSKPSSGLSSPQSSTTTLSPPSPVPDTRTEDFDSPTQASHIIEFIASRSTASSFVYVYDVAEQVGFGTLTKKWAQIHKGSATAIDLQTRAGAGFSLVGRLSQGTSSDAVKGTILTAYTTPSGLAIMAPSFTYLPTASPTSRLIIQTPMVTPVGDTLSLSPTLASIASAWSLLPENITVLLSSTPQQSVDFAALSYRLTTSHVIHLFDHHSTSRETGHSFSPIAKSFGGDAATVHDVVHQAGYSFFEYHGDKEATTAIIVLNGPLAASLTATVNGHPVAGLGVVVVNVLRPWDDIAIQSVVPSSVTKVHVFDDVPNTVTQGALYVDVFSALWSIKSPRSIHGHRIIPADTQNYINEKDAFLHFIREIANVDIQALPDVGAKKLLLFSTPQSPLSALPNFLQQLFLTDSGTSSRLLTDHDVFSKPGGIMTSRLLISHHADSRNTVPIPIELPLSPNSLGHADFLAILDQSLLKTHSLLEYAKPGSVVLVSTPWTSAEFTSNLPRGLASLILVRDLHIYLIDTKGITESLLERQSPHQDIFQNLLLAFAFLELYIGPSVSQAQVLQILCKCSDVTIPEFPLCQAAARVCSSLVPVQISVPDDDSCDGTPSLKGYEFNAIAVETEGETVVNGARLSSWHDAAKHLIFPAVYAPSPEEQIGDPALRPEVPETTFLVTCTVNKRLTPLEYDRNVFHLEFDTSNTGLKYSIGEALGVHGWNDEQEVYDFCNWYGVDPNRLITLPVGPDESKVHTRTIFQALQQQIDIYGRPPKSFYTDLAEYATADVDRYGLRFIGSPEGSSTFKKLSEVDTVSFADVLRKFPSARPGIERLCELIGDIKPRHYSIASAQSVVGDRVDLLVVTVDWLTPSGTLKYGQCTRYLAGLKVGQKVAVSIKPSVMKLPVDIKQPLIMAGLGTGAAPFRAFLQHLALLSRRGEEVGPVYYYFGSRYQGAEYLYGEEIEAFFLDGIITRAGLAFSRDGPKKVYIQHKMLEDSEALANMLHDEKGVFYLCGPTWPVPDVYEALVNALVKYKGFDPIKAGEYLESLKEEERYVLEVY